MAAKANNLPIVALSDVNPIAMEDKIKRFSLLSKTYLDYRIMLEKERPNLVAIATPSGEHAKIALDCIEAGGHVIIEKPIALSMNDASSIIAAAKKKAY